MNPFPSLLPFQTNLRFHGAASSLLQDLPGAGPLYLHARNWMAELAAITPLTGLVIDEDERAAFFPEEGLHLSLDAVQAIHGIAIEHHTHPALAIELASHGEPRALSIAAIPNFSDLTRFSSILQRHPSERLSEETYQEWRRASTLLPRICSCCAAAAEERRENPERNPLTRILCHAIEEQATLRCRLRSTLFSFATPLLPRTLQFSDHKISVIAADGKSMLEVDLGICASLRIHLRKIDDEAFSVLQVFDSTGHPHLELAAPGPQMGHAWQRRCEEA